ncbi:MAG: LrgB family protein [Acetobacteraceae bacterium]|jgi:putative effector of murein hydrolase|nr:LrgB family protein [Acetobacteraceae bacterium]
MSGAGQLPFLVLTLGAWALAAAAWQATGRHALANPTLVAIILVAGVLAASGADLGRYQTETGVIHLLLGPAVVSLAVPLYRHAPMLAARTAVLALALIAGAVLNCLLALAVLAALGGSAATLASLAPKSATAAVAMAVSTETGGIAALTAVVTILAGITGAVFGPALLDRLGIRDPIARGFGLGLASHGIGTARAFQESEAAGTTAGLAMGLNAIVTALIVPLVLRYGGLLG